MLHFFALNLGVKNAPNFSTRVVYSLLVIKNIFHTHAKKEKETMEIIKLTINGLIMS
jgi:hypothetical protein